MLLLFGGPRNHMKSYNDIEIFMVQRCYFYTTTTKRDIVPPNFKKIHKQIYDKKIAIHCLSAGTFHYTRSYANFRN